MAAETSNGRASAAKGKGKDTDEIPAYELPWYVSLAAHSACCCVQDASTSYASS